MHWTTLAAGIPTGAAPTGPATTTDWILLAFYLGLAIGVSFLCSMLEAGILSLTKGYIASLVAAGSKAGKRLEKMKEEVDRPLAAILTLNTVAHTVGAAGAGAQILKIFGNAWVAVGSAVVTLLILVFSEIIPKSIGAAKAQQLSGFTAIGIQVMIWITLPLLIPLGWIAKLFGGEHKPRLSRAEVQSIAEMGLSDGALNRNESKTISNLLKLSQVLTEDVMTPRPVVQALQQDRRVSDVMTAFPKFRFARMPVYSDTIDHVTGVVLRHRILRAAADGRGGEPLSSLADPVGTVTEDLPVGEVLNRLIKERSHLFMVADRFGGTAGVVTLEDCIETLLGVEILDETDTVADMRQLARRRVEKLRKDQEHQEASARGQDKKSGEADTPSALDVATKLQASDAAADVRPGED